VRTHRWAGIAALALAVACSPGAPDPDPTATTEQAALDPCDLVSPETVADVVGPALPAPWRGLGADTRSGSCTWRLDVEVGDVDDVVRRPTFRSLQVRTTATNDCAGVPSSEPTPTESGAAVRFCWDDGTADVSYEARDTRGGNDVQADKAQLDLVLKRVTREVDQRRAQAQRLEPNPTSTQTATPRPVQNPCDLVTSQTLQAIGTPKPSDPIEYPEFSKCVWFGGKRSLALTVTPHGTGQGHPGRAYATTALQQFAYVWQARPQGDAAYVVQATTVLARATVGTYQVDVSLYDPHTGPRQPDAARVVADATKALPR
jgi:hypothetical protein